jgi:hypothetical protein
MFLIFLCAVSNTEEIAGGVPTTFSSAGHFLAESAGDKMNAYRLLPTAACDPFRFYIWRLLLVAYQHYYLFSTLSTSELI